MNINDFLKLNLLTEANVYNIKLPVNNISVESYLKHYLADITDPTIKPQLTKKLSLLLVNNEDNLILLPQVPPNAPDWAQTAARAGELYAFVPSENLNDNISNIAHYVQAVINDTQDRDNNIVVRAKQELGAIPKVPDLNSLAIRANQWFAIGVTKAEKKAKTNTEGMSKVQDYNGWTWYKLETPDAFKREGKTLQNCIGIIWTFEKAQKDNAFIYILRTEANDSVVAVRTHGNVIQEIKGKNNKPPVEKYMPYVFSFVKDSVLDLSSNTAKWELKNAGYWVFNNKIIVPMDKAADMFFDEETQKLRKIVVDDTIQILDKEFNVYNNKSAVKHMADLGGIGGIPEIVYKGNVGDFSVIFASNTAKELSNSNGLGTNAQQPEAKAVIAKYLVALGTQEQLKMGPRLRQEYGLSSKSPYTPIPEMVTLVGKVDTFDKLDVSKLSGFDHWIARTMFFKGAQGPKQTEYISIVDYEKLVKKGINLDRTKTMYRSYKQNGSVEVTLFVDSKNSIFAIDAPYNITSNQLGKFRKIIATEKLTIEKSATPSPKVVVIPPSTILSKEEFLTNKMAGKQTEHTKTVIEFEDGASFKLLEGKPLTDWLEQATVNTTTDAVYTLMIDNQPIIALPVSKKKITGMFARDERPNSWRDRQLEEKGQVAQPTTKTLDFKYGHYIKEFAKKLGLSIESKNLLIKPDSKMEQFLTFVVNNPNQVRFKALRAAHVGSASAPGINAPYNMLDRPLIQLGLIKIAPTPPNKKSIYLIPTETGKEVARKLKAGESVPMFDLINKTASIKGGNDYELEPTPIRAHPNPNAAPRAPREARPAQNHGARVGSKAEQIYNLFVQMTNDNNGTMPARGAFIDLIMQPPYNMTRAGASTYHYNMKTKYLQQHGQLGETFTFKEWLVAIFD